MIPFPRSMVLFLSLADACVLSWADAVPAVIPAAIPSAITAAIPAAIPAGFRVYACDPGRSSVAYNAVHPFAKVRGVNHAPACTVWVSPDTAEFRIKVSLEVRGFKSGIKLRDSHAMKAVAADSFPAVVFASASVRPSAGRFGPYAVSGDLAFHGRTRPVQATVTPEVKNGVITVRGGFPISLAEFQARPPSLMGTKVKDKVEMTFEFVFNGGAPSGGGLPDGPAE
jgi:polyisoprenoid-binding protein YceI